MTSRLRSLLEAATPGPWTEQQGSIYGEFEMVVERVESIDGQVLSPLLADAALIVALRNQAECLLDVVDAARALSDDEESQEGGWGPDVTMLIPLRDALARLDSEESS
jgi:hypothetical protein